jgi:hypothetical protein
MEKSEVGKKYPLEKHKRWKTRREKRNAEEKRKEDGQLRRGKR